MNENDLDRLLAEARANPPAPGTDFMARILQDALAEQPRPVPQAVSRPTVEQSRPRSAGSLQAGVLALGPAARPGFWARLTAGLGGSGVMAGLGAVALTGLWLGYADPAGLTDTYLTYADASGLELVPAAEMFLSEG